MRPSPHGGDEFSLVPRVPNPNYTQIYTYLYIYLSLRTNCQTVCLPVLILAILDRFMTVFVYRFITVFVPVPPEPQSRQVSQSGRPPGTP